MARSKSKYVKFRGKSVYAMVYRPDEFNGQEFWKIGLAVDKAGAEEIKESGSQVRVKYAEEVPNIDDGTRFFTFRRPAQKTFKNGTVNFCPPTIYDKKGKNLVSYHRGKEQVYQYDEGTEEPERRGEPVIIGNGSEVEVTVCIYPAGSYGKGTRLESVKIIDLIEYNPDDEEETEPEDDEAPFDTDDKSDDKRTPLEKELNDEIPFGEDQPEEEEKPKKKPTKSKVGW